MLIRSKKSLDGHFEVGLGEEIAATGVIRELKGQYPDEIIHIDNRFPEIYYNNPHIDAGKVDSPYMVELNTNEIGNLAYDYAKCLGIKIFNSDPEIFLTNEEISEGIQPANTIAIDTWAGWPIRRWDVNNFIKLTNLLHELKFRVIEIGKTVFSCIPNKRGEKLPNVDESYLDKLTIRETASVIKSCRLYIGNDSGLFHLSAAVGTKHIVIYPKQEFAIYRKYHTTYPLASLKNECKISCGDIEHWTHCDKCAAAMNEIQPEDVIKTIYQNKL